MIVEERQVDAESIELGAIAEAERRDAVRLIAEDAAVSEPRVPVRVAAGIMLDRLLGHADAVAGSSPLRAGDEKGTESCML